jgi:hypothetical protein
VSYDDPYGLKLCADRQFRRAISVAFNARITWRGGCIVSFVGHGGGHWTTLQTKLLQPLVSDPAHRFTVTSTSVWHWRDWAGSRFAGSGRDWEARIDVSQGDLSYQTRLHGACRHAEDLWSVEALVVHELGHLLGVAIRGVPYAQNTAISWENQFNRAYGRDLRSPTCGDSDY